MSRNAYALFPYEGGVDFDVRNWGGGIDAGPQKWGGMVAYSQKCGGGDPLAGEGRAILHTPPSVCFWHLP